MDRPLTATLPLVRRRQRHSHDIFDDQVRWLNRVKFELEEETGQRLTSNAIVALAIDLLRLDYERDRDRSQLVRVLLRGEAAATVDSEGDD